MYHYLGGVSMWSFAQTPSRCPQPSAGDARRTAHGSAADGVAERGVVDGAPPQLDGVLHIHVPAARIKSLGSILVENQACPAVHNAQK
jgi:hypothetical protein